MSLHDGSRFRGRLVDIETTDGKKVFAFSCGENVCTGEYFNGRFAYVAGDKKVFAFTSEGCQPPLSPTSFGNLFDETCVDATAYTNAAGLLPFFVEADAFTVEVEKPCFPLEVEFNLTITCNDGGEGNPECEAITCTGPESVTIIITI